MSGMSTKYTLSPRKSPPVSSEMGGILNGFSFAANNLSSLKPCEDIIAFTCRMSSTNPALMAVMPVSLSVAKFSGEL